MIIRIHSQFGMNVFPSVLFSYDLLQTCLPALKADIAHAREKVNQELEEIGEGVPEETDAKRKLLNKVCHFPETMV